MKIALAEKEVSFEVSLLRRRSAAREQLERWFTWLVLQLDSRDWVNGESFGWGDLSVVPFSNGAAAFGCAPTGRLSDRLARVNERASVAACIRDAAAAGAADSEISLEQVRGLLDQGLFKCEYRDHRLEWMIKTGGLEIVKAGLKKNNIRFIEPF